jgi:hypothetical protein
LNRTALLAAALLLGGCGDDAPPRPPEPPRAEARLGPYPRSQFYLDHDLFLAADEPRTVPAEEATFLAPDDEVLGLVVAGRARAYAVTMLAYHHVVNDVIEGIPVAVTY